MPDARSVVREYQPVGKDEGERILQALQQSRGNKSRAAQALGLTLRQINYRIKILGLSV